MKKAEILSLAGAGVAGAIGGAAVHRRVRRRQKKAERAGGHVPCGFYELYVKRPLDAVLAAVFLTGLSPILGICALAVGIKLGRPILFTQERPGLDGRGFILCKFRTMTEEQGKDGRPLPDGERLTAFGKMLRATSVDELPELWNILRGDMAFVGPRPLLMEYLPLYSERQASRHEVRPGLTGLAQVNGRNGLSWEERLEMDVQYAEKITFLGDLKIILRTAAVVLKKEGISSGSSATMEAFMGSGTGKEQEA